jgi:hypothetical protein
LIGGIAVITEHLVIRHGHISGWILREVGFCYRVIRRIRFKLKLLPALPPNPLRGVYRIELTLALTVRVVVLCNLTAGLRPALLPTGVTWIIACSGSCATGLLRLLPLLTTLRAGLDIHSLLLAPLLPSLSVGLLAGLSLRCRSVLLTLTGGALLTLLILLRLSGLSLLILYTLLITLLPNLVGRLLDRLRGLA